MLQTGLDEESVRGLASTNALRTLMVADTEWDSVPPLGWRPAAVVALPDEHLPKEVFDRVSSTSQTLCADQPDLAFGYQFVERGSGFCRVVIRVSSASVVEPLLVTVRARDRSHPRWATVGEGACAVDGGRCLVEATELTPTGGDLQVSVEMATASGEPFCVRLHDVTPIRCVPADR
jgi:hypothetical protein